MGNLLRWKAAQFFEIRWWKNYLKDQSTENYLSWKQAYWKNILNQIKGVINLKEGDPILDVGCGPSGIYMVLNEYRVDAVDPLINKYESSLSHFSIKNYPYVNFHTSTIEDFQADKKYGLVFCLNAINHIADLQKGLSKIIGAIKDNGQLVISIDAHNYTFFKKLFRLFPADILHPHQYNINEYQKMLVKKNCSILKTITLKKDFIFSYYLLVAKKN